MSMWGCTTYLDRGPLCIIFSSLEGQRQNSELNFRESSIQKQTFFYLTSRFTACELIFLPLKLFWIVISCKFFNSSMKFTFIHIISVIQVMFLVFCNLLRGPDITGSGAGPAGCASLVYDM